MHRDSMGDMILKRCLQWSPINDGVYYVMSCTRHSRFSAFNNENCEWPGDEATHSPCQHHTCFLHASHTVEYTQQPTIHYTSTFWDTFIWSWKSGIDVHVAWNWLIQISHKASVSWRCVSSHLPAYFLVGRLFWPLSPFGTTHAQFNYNINVSIPSSVR